MAQKSPIETGLNGLLRRLGDGLKVLAEPPQAPRPPTRGNIPRVAVERGRPSPPPPGGAAQSPPQPRQASGPPPPSTSQVPKRRVARPHGQLAPARPAAPQLDHPTAEEWPDAVPQPMAEPQVQPAAEVQPVETQQVSTPEPVVAADETEPASDERSASEPSAGESVPDPDVAAAGNVKKLRPGWETSASGFVMPGPPRSVALPPGPGKASVPAASF